MKKMLLYSIMPLDTEHITQICEDIHAQYGDKLSFHGTIGTQTTMPFGSPEDVKREVWHNLEIAGEHGGLFVAPTHLLEPEVPVENVAAYIEACRDFK